MNHRFILEEGGLRWDRITVQSVQPRGNEHARQSLSVGGLVSGREGALLLRLPGMTETYWAMDPAEARALRDALVARVTEDPDRDAAPGAEGP